MGQLAADLVPSQVPTRRRYMVLGLVCALSMITYLDRTSIGSSTGQILTSLHLKSKSDLKWAFFAFSLGYALFEIPSGWLGDVFGPRTTLIRIVLWWSVFVTLTGMVGMTLGGYMLGGVGLLVVVQFLFGMGEAGAYPNIARALHNWFPLQQRGTTQGALWMSGRLMGGLTPLIWMLLVRAFHGYWRAAFWCFGGLGILWCLIFSLWFKNRPEENASVNAAELALIRSGGGEARPAQGKVPWRTIFTSRNLWLLCVMYACQSYGWYFNVYYLPGYMEDRYQVVSPSDAGIHGVNWEAVCAALYKGGPLWLGALGCLLGGILTDAYIRRTGNRKLGRRIFGITGHSLSTVCFLLCPLAPNAFWFFVVISMSAFTSDLTMGSSWASCQDIGRRYTAIVAGTMNMVGNLGGAAVGWATGYILELSQDAYASRLGMVRQQLSDAQTKAGSLAGYNVCFLIFAAVYLVAVLCWTRLDATQPVAPDA
jgi:ACS family glucarate transporter-like MFS transporter